MKSQVTKFDLAAAFKELDSLDYPIYKEEVEEKPAVKLNESVESNRKVISDLLLEDVYNINSTDGLEQAKADRDEAIAKAKLARIEKIVDLEAETEDDLLPSYVGKVIVQCPQCMTLFYKNPEDIEKSEEDENIVNINEICQHCGNSSGYEVVGKVAEAKSEEVGNYEGGEESAEETGDLDLNFGEATAEVDPEGTGEAEVTETDELNLDDIQLDEIPVAEEEPAEEEEEKKEESFVSFSGMPLYEDFDDVDNASQEIAEVNDAIEKELAECDVQESLNNSELLKDCGEKSDLKTEHGSENLTLNESDEEEADQAIEDLAAEINADIASEEEVEDDSAKDEDVAVEMTSQEVADTVADVAHEVADAVQDVVEPTEEQADEVKEVVDEIVTDKVEEILPDVEAVIEEPAEEVAAEDEAEETTEEVAEEEVVEESLNNSQLLKDCKDGSELDTEHGSENLTINEDLDDNIKQWNYYLNYLQALLKQDEEALEEAKKVKNNEDVIKAIEKRIANDKADIDAALPNIVKEKAAIEELPTPEDAGEDASIEGKEEAKNESLQESNDVPVVKCPVNDVITHSEDEKPLDCKMEKKPLEKPLTESNELVMSEEALDKMYSSREFETPISDSEVEAMLGANESLEECNKLEDIANVSDVREEMLEKCIAESLTNVYENVDSFKVSNCEITDNKFIVEGVINFKSSAKKNTTYVFTEAISGEDRTKLIGINESLDPNGKFVLNCYLESAKTIMMAESLEYSYHIGESLVEGITK